MSETVFGGDHMTFTENAEGQAEISYTPQSLNGRTCGGCTLCCKLLPVRAMEKPANQRCRHAQHGRGCTIYADRPFDCRAWACRWVSDKPATEGMPRPDRAHYVVDIMPDYVTLTEHATGERYQIGVVQVWVDPAWRNAWRTPALLAFMARQAEKRIATLVRFNSADAITVFPPAFDKDGEWHEIAGGVEVRD
jgi:hypothetical protein